MNYKRLENESDKDLINRICSEKDEIGSWQTVADIINNILGTNFTESKYRKNFRLYSEGYNDSQNKSIQEHNFELEKKLNEIKKERIKLQTLNAERNKIDRIEARKELYYEQIGNMITTLEPPVFNDWEPNIAQIEEDHKEEYLLTIADIHSGATFKTEYNEYSPAIMLDRFDELTQKTISFIKKHNCKVLHVVGLGDFIQGCIHMNDLKINDSTVVKATVQVSQAMAEFLNKISKYARIDYYHIISSNHSQMRYLGTKASELMGEDMEYIIGHYIKDSLSNNKNVDVYVDEEASDYKEFEILNYKIIAMHGHQVKDINTLLNSISSKRNEMIDYIILGHQHNHKIITGNDGCTYDTEVLVSPSFVGSDPFADSIMKGSKAAVMIYGFHEYEGHNETYKFILN